MSIGEVRASLRRVVTFGDRLDDLIRQAGPFDFPESHVLAELIAAARTRPHVAAALEAALGAVEVDAQRKPYALAGHVAAS